MKYKTYNFNSFNFYTIKTDKFKSCHMEVVFRNKMHKEEIMPRKFLVELLSYSTKKYNTQKDLSIHLEELYNTSFYSLLSRVGGVMFTTFCLDFINPKYCEKGFLNNVLNLIFDFLFNPNIENDEFDNESFNIIKNIFISEIQAAKENFKSYAYRRLFQSMDKEAYLGYDMLGTLEDIETITPKNLVTEYHKMLDKDYCDIYLIGDLDMDYIANFLENNFQNRIIKNYDLCLFSEGKARNKIQVIKEQANISQANLLVGCNLVTLDNEEKDIIAYLYNFILGAGSLDTKLGTYLRQDNSLCYTVNSIYQKYDSAIIIYAGIDAKNYNKAVSLIKKALKEMTTQISEEELDNAKKGLITSLNMIADSPSNLINNYLFRNVANLKTVEERIKEIKNISISDIKKIAKKVKINTIYMLSGVE